MDNSPCFQCNMYVANKFRKFQDGSYKKMFCLEENPSNKYFVRNPMKQEYCQNLNDVVCYDIQFGASDCKPVNNDILSYDIQGNLIKRKYMYY